ncbi:nitrilase-related carbon-nitrogen hydrolase [Desulfosediminicola sp.]|uniref:nitrilase-related carbon-nitrogen hydrolase n=1 Tax=Desulfosediminicola sp. TaxID=2886825 RepID=UPI003AF31755
MQDLRVTLVQSDIIWENPTANREVLTPQLTQLAGQTDLIILPEMFTTGFTLAGEQLAEVMDNTSEGTTAHWLTKMASVTGAAITGSCIIRDDGKLYNRLLWATPDGELYHYDKNNLFSFAGEDSVYSGGEALLTVHLKGWRIRPFICFDLRFPEWSSRRKGTYDLGIYVANWPDSRQNHWFSLLLARAIENQIYVAGVNRIGRDGNRLCYAGGSVLVDPEGEVLHECGRDQAVTTHQLDGDSLQAYRKRFPM